MIRRVVCSLVAATVLASTATAIEAPLPRHPAPSEDLSASEDTQLRRAVEALLADLESDPRTGAW